MSELKICNLVITGKLQKVVRLIDYFYPLLYDIYKAKMVKVN
jgi:hypothetical protein